MDIVFANSSSGGKTDGGGSHDDFWASERAWQKAELERSFTISVRAVGVQGVRLLGLPRAVLDTRDGHSPKATVNKCRGAIWMFDCVVCCVGGGPMSSSFGFADFGTTDGVQHIH
jgi:hypothetical protein